MRSRRSVVGLVLLSHVLMAASARAQGAEATISGFVTDDTQAVLPGVTVTATHVGTKQQVVGVTNEQGFYVLQPVPIGAYVVEAALEGFGTYRREGVTVTTQARLGLDITLSVGGLEDTVTVNAELPLLESRSSEVGQLIESRAVESMPLGDRRSMNLIRMTGAAVFVNYDTGAKPNFSLAGGRTQSQSFMIDGGTGQNMRLGIGQVDVDPPVETVQEVRVLSNNYAAEFGGSAGGVITATTKSGTNTFRGVAFEYFRHDGLDAAGFFAPFVDGRKQKEQLRYNVFGGTFGGPIVRNRTFFFFSYEGNRRTLGETRTLTVPTELQRGGDFSQTLNAAGSPITIYDPATTTPGGARQPFPGNVIPSDRLDPVGLRLTDFYPLPNRTPDNPSGANNFSANANERLERDNYLIKVDHALTSRDKITARYLYNSDNRFPGSVLPEPAADTQSDALRHQNYVYVSHTRTFGRAVNELRYTYANRINHTTSPGLGAGWPSQIGLQGVSDEAFPRISVAGFAPLGATNHERRQFPIEQHQIADTLSYVRGRHTWKTGFEVRPSFNSEVNRPSISGNFNFTTQPTGLPGRSDTGYGLASLLLGFPNGVTVRETDVLDRSSWYLAAFLQDDWTVTSNLTINLGVRWEVDTPLKDENQRMSGFDPEAINPVSGTPGVVRFAGVDGWRELPYETDWNNFGPRVGFAWRPFGVERTVVRGGVGIFYGHPFDHGGPSTPSLGFERSASLSTPDNGLTAPFYLRDGVPRLETADQPHDERFGAVPVGEPTTTEVVFFEPNRKTSYAQQFNIGLQHELPGHIVVEAAYVGNISRKLPGQNLSINQIPPEDLEPGVTQADRPFPQFTDVTIRLPSIGRSDYHAGALRVERRFDRGFSLLGTYTYAHFKSDTDMGGSDLGDVGVYSDFYDRQADYGPAGNDIRHRLTIGSVYELPIGPGKRWLSSGWLGHVIGGWSLGLLGTLQSGPPFSVTTQTNTTNAFSAGALRANVVADPELPTGERSITRWFDTEAFTQPAPLTFGNSPRGVLRGDGIVNFDLSLAKSVALGGERVLQARIELFNMFNHPNFDVPGHVLGGPNFGVVSSAGPARTVQLGLRFAF